jgi:hypothetical protein
MQVREIKSAGIHVNFDPALMALLREAKYFSLIKVHMLLLLTKPLCC